MVCLALGPRVVGHPQSWGELPALLEVELIVAAPCRSKDSLVSGAWCDRAKGWLCSLPLVP